MLAMDTKADATMLVVVNTATTVEEMDTVIVEGVDTTTVKEANTATEEEVSVS